MHSNLTTTLHGVFISIYGVGVLITGESGVGKSELALSLITRGHQLIADDAPIFIKTGATTILGKCPEILKNFLQIHNVGILNIASLFGERAVLAEQNLAVVVQLQHNINLSNSSPFSDHSQLIKILDIEIPHYTFSINRNRHLEILIEALIRNYLVKQTGYDANQDFLNRHEHYILKETVTNFPTDLTNSKNNGSFPQPSLIKENLG